MDELTNCEKKTLQLIHLIQELYQEKVGVSEIARRTGKSIGTIKKYCQGEPLELCRTEKKGSKRKRPSMLDPYKDMILEKIHKKVHQAEIIRYITKNGYTGTPTNAQIYIQKLCKECGITASKYRSGGNSLGSERTGNGKSMEKEYITRTSIFQHIWIGEKLDEETRIYLWEKYPALYEINACVNEFREIFKKRNMVLLYLFIEKYLSSTMKELVSFASGLKKDMEAIENAVASDKSNGFVEGTNNRLKMLKRTMYGRCEKHLLSAKMMMEKNM